MGMYTELNIGVNLVSSTPDYVIDIIKYMLNPESEYDEIKLPDHPLFKTARWRYMLLSDSYYFGGTTNSCMEYDGIFKQHELNVRSNLKNYESEIELFLNFIQPYIDFHGFIGYMRYEEFDIPTLIYNTYECHIELVIPEENSQFRRYSLDDEWLEDFRN